MKVLKFSLLFILLTVTLPYVSDSQIFRGGLILGMNGSQIDGDSMSGFNKGGLHVGVFIDYVITKEWYASFEMLFSQLGSHDKENIDGNINFQMGPWYSLTLSYFQIPLFLNYVWHEKYVVYAGPEFGILINTKYVNENREVIQSARPVKTFDLIPALGLQYQVLPRIGIFTQFSYSLLNIGRDKSKTLISKTNRGMHNNVISAGVRFYIGPVKNNL